MAESAQSGRASVKSLIALLIGAIVISALYFGRELLIPIALSVLLTFILLPLVSWLRRRGLPRVPAVFSAVLLAFALVGGVGLVVAGQAMELVDNLPTYKQNISAKIRSLRESVPGGSMFDRAAETIRDLEREVEDDRLKTPGTATPREAPPPEVRVRQEASTFSLLGTWALPLLSPLVMAGLVIVFVVFFLLGREDLRNRAIRLIGGELHATTDAMDEAARRVSRYLLLQLMINFGTSIPFGVALYFIGLPNAVLWAVLAAVLRFIPYIGPLIAALMPATVAAAVDPGWGMLLWTLGVYVAMEAITNNVIEPRVYGAGTGISEVAIIMSAIFWTALWGPVGLFLSTPVTVCLAVMGRHVPGLHFFDVLLGKTPVLTPVEQFYQRMLAGDPVEGTQIAETYTKEKPAIEFYEDVALPALSLAERDRQRGALAPERCATITQSVLEVIDDFNEDEADEKEEGEKEEGGREADNIEAGSFVCFAARTSFDFAAAAMLAKLLRRRGYMARPLPAEALSLDGISSLDPAGVDGFFLCYVGFANTAHARHLLRRLRRRVKKRPLVVAVWPREFHVSNFNALAESIKPARVVRSIEEGMNAASEILQGTSKAYQPPAVPGNENERLAELRRLNLLDMPPDERFDRVTKRLAKAFGAPIALLSFVDDDRQVWKSQVGLPSDLAKARQAPRALSICGHVVAEDALLAVEDVSKDKRFANNPFLRERGIRFYAGAPLRTSSGFAVGSLCVMDTAPRKFTDDDRQRLESAASEVAEEIERDAKARGEEKSTESLSAAA
jgi:predicted PurR-regulated permease PerM